MVGRGVRLCGALTIYSADNCGILNANLGLIVAGGIFLDDWWFCDGLTD